MNLNNTDSSTSQPAADKSNSAVRISERNVPSLHLNIDSSASQPAADNSNSAVSRISDNTVPSLHLNIDSSASQPVVDNSNSAVNISQRNVPPFLIKTPAPTDIMDGRGNFRNHEGNQAFQKIIDNHKVAYRTASTADKPQVVNSVYSQVIPRMRFVKRDVATSLWKPEVLSPRDIKYKIRQKICDSTNPGKSNKAACKLKHAPAANLKKTPVATPAQSVPVPSQHPSGPVGINEPSLIVPYSPMEVAFRSSSAPADPFSSEFSQEPPSPEMMQHYNTMLVARIKADVVRQNPGLA